MEPERQEDNVDLNKLAAEMDDRSTNGLLEAIRRAQETKSGPKEETGSKESILRFDKKKTKE
jgi:hypothetical protein